MLERIRAWWAKGRPEADPEPEPRPQPAPTPVARHKGLPLRRTHLGAVFATLARSKARLPVPAAAFIGAGLCDALAFGAAIDCRREPLAPGDVTLFEGGEVQLNLPTRASPRRMRGRFGYMSPEQVRGQPADSRSDVYCLGIVLFEMSTGTRAFTGDSDFAVLDKALHGTCPDPLSVCPTLSLELATLILNTLRVDPALRPTAAELKLRLQPHLTGWDRAAFGAWLRAYLPPVSPVPAPPPDPTVPLDEAQLLAAVHRGDDAARLVYADWLLERGFTEAASWLQLELQCRTATGGELNELLGRLAPLTRGLGPEFLAAVSRPAIEGCAVRFGFKCPLKWEALALTGDPAVRSCSGCHQDVHWCANVEQARELARKGRCVAVSPAALRSPDDLELDDRGGATVGMIA